MFGIDATSTQDHAGLHAKGVRFACRYLSPTSWKNLARDEARSLQQHGIAPVTVWESTGQTVRGGRAAGIRDALGAKAELFSLGRHGIDPVFFAVDYDLQPHEYHLLEAYLGGAASVLGWHRTGLYAGYGPCHAAATGGWCRFIWQTYAWSGGRWEPHAHIRQYLNGQIIDGQQVDFDLAMARNFGQWDPPAVPLPKPRPRYVIHAYDDAGKLIFARTALRPTYDLRRWGVVQHHPARVEILRVKKA